MQIFVKALAGRTLNFSVEQSETIESVKAKIHQTLEFQNIGVAQQRLVFAGKQLDDSSTLSHCSITNEATLHLILRLRGGKGANN